MSKKAQGASFEGGTNLRYNTIGGNLDNNLKMKKTTVLTGNHAPKTRDRAQSDFEAIKISNTLGHKVDLSGLRPVPEVVTKNKASKQYGNINPETNGTLVKHSELPEGYVYRKKSHAV